METLEERPAAAEVWVGNQPPTPPLSLQLPGVGALAQAYLKVPPC